MMHHLIYRACPASDSVSRTGKDGRIEEASDLSVIRHTRAVDRDVEHPTLHWQLYRRVFRGYDVRKVDEGGVEDVWVIRMGTGISTMFIDMVRVDIYRTVITGPNGMSAYTVYVAPRPPHCFPGSHSPMLVLLTHSSMRQVGETKRSRARSALGVGGDEDITRVTTYTACLPATPLAGRKYALQDAPTSGCGW
jgi:hypothetical protein